MKKVNKTKFYYTFIYFLLIFILIKPTWLLNNQDLGSPGNDDLSYWLHAATIVYDFDFDYLKDYPLQEKAFNSVTNTPYHPPGAGYLSAPFVFFFSLFDKQLPQRLNPVGSYAYIGYYLSTLFYFLAGIELIRRIIFNNKKFNNSTPVILFSLFTGTLCHYVVTRFLMSHAVEFFICCCICYIYEIKDVLNSKKNLFNLIFFYFLLSITRPSTFIYTLCLFLVYLKKEDIKFINYFYSLSLTTFFVTVHVLLSKKLYSTYSIFNNYQANFNDQNFIEFDFSFVFSKLIYIPNLIFSFSFGLIWTIPVVAFGIVLLWRSSFFYDKNTFSKFFTFLYFFGAIVVVIVWQGRDVSFGQRLLVGLIPFCGLRLNELLVNQKLKKIFIIFVSVSYLGYFYLYTSTNLNLSPGRTLWGNTVGLTGEKYFLYLFTEFYYLENILSAFSRTFIIVNLLNIFKFETIEIVLIKIISDPEKLNRLEELSSIYSNSPVTYFLLINFLVIIFSFIFASQITKKEI